MAIIRTAQRSCRRRIVFRVILIIIIVSFFLSFYPDFLSTHTSQRLGSGTIRTALVLRSPERAFILRIRIRTTATVEKPPKISYLGSISVTICASIFNFVCYSV